MLTLHHRNHVILGVNDKSVISMLSLMVSREDEKEVEHPRDQEGVESQPSGAGQDGEEEEVPRINVEIPRCVAHLGSELYFAKLPNFLSVETR